LIKTYEYRVPLDGQDEQTAIAKINEHAELLIRIRPYLLNVAVRPEGTRLHIQLRLTDIDQWRLASHARKTIIAMCIRAKVGFKNIELYQALEEPNARSFMLGQGRSPRPRRPRSREAVPPVV
jgi:hypothetical protein